MTPLEVHDNLRQGPKGRPYHLGDGEDVPVSLENFRKSVPTVDEDVSQSLPTLPCKGVREQCKGLRTT